MNLRYWLLNLLSLCWWIAHPREAAQAIREAGDWAERELKAMEEREHTMTVGEAASWATRIKSALHGSRGFTLIELLIVLAILGIIIGAIAMGARPMMVGG